MTGGHLAHDRGDVLLVELDVEVVGQRVKREAATQGVLCLGVEVGLPSLVVKAGLGEDVVEREALHLQALHRLGEQLVAHLGHIALVGLALQTRGQLGSRELEELCMLGSVGLALEHRADLAAKAKKRLGLGQVLHHPTVVDDGRHAVLDLVDLHLDLHDLVVDGAVLGGHGKRQAVLLALARGHAHELVVELVAQLAGAHQVGNVAAGELREGLAVERGVEVETHVVAALDLRGRRVVLPGGKLFGHVVEIGRHVLGAHGLLLGNLHAHRLIRGKLVGGAQQALHLEHVVLALHRRLARQVVGVEERQDGGAQQGLGEEVALHERRDEGVEGTLAHLRADGLEGGRVGRHAEGGSQAIFGLLDGLADLIGRRGHREVGHTLGVRGHEHADAAGLGIVLKLALVVGGRVRELRKRDRRLRALEIENLAHATRPAVP